MLGIEKAYGNAVIKALLHANRDLMEATAEDALIKSSRYGKPDTLGLDAISEIAISTQVKKFDQHAILITEEQGDPPGSFTNVSADPRSFRTFFISDPTDRSKQFAEFLTDEKDKKRRVLDIMRDPESRAKWETKFSAPAGITGPFSAITCIRRGVPILTALVNYLTQEIFLACSAGIFVMPIDFEQKSLDKLTAKDICLRADHVTFDLCVGRYQGLKKFVTFLGKEGYFENLLESHLLSEDEIAQSVFYDEPGGPSRILYHSTIFSREHGIGFILANGEKIGEWIHWLPFIRFARGVNDLSEPILNIYEIWHPRPNTKDGILMSTSPNYSIFRQTSNGRMIIDVSIFQRFSNPSRIRSTLLVCMNSNDWAQQIVQRYGYRKIQF